MPTLKSSMFIISTRIIKDNALSHLMDTVMVMKCVSDIVFDSNYTAAYEQSLFLSNDHNEKMFVTFLMTYFESAGFVVLQAKDDADTLFV